MTEQMAIEYLLNRYLVVGSPVNPPKEECEKHNAVIDMAIQALEKQSMVNEILNELKQYRAIGTVEELQALKENQRKCEDCAGCTNWNCDCYNERVMAIEEFAEQIELGISESIIWDMLATASKNGSLSDTSDKIVDYVIETIKEIAESMKGEKE